MKTDEVIIEIVSRAYKAIENSKPRSAWDRGVKEYTLELLEDLDTNARNGYLMSNDIIDRKMLKANLLNGAGNWNEYSWGGCSLIYDYQIARRLCAPWELRKTHDGEKDPNPREQWLDVQARALSQAGCKAITAVRNELFNMGWLK